MEDLSGTVGNALVQASMLPTSTVTSAPKFSPPGTESESVLDGDVRPRATPVGPVSPRYIAGVGDRGGVLPGDGTDPGAGHPWVNVNDRPGDESRWSTAVDPHMRDDRT
jgi:hypothetical protein